MLAARIVGKTLALFGLVPLASSAFHVYPEAMNNSLLYIHRVSLEENMALPKEVVNQFPGL